LDLLSYLWSQLGVQSLPLWLGLLATGIAAVTALARRPRDLADLCGAAAFISVVAFFFGKWAFLNYYFLTAVFIVLALASQGLRVDLADDQVRLPLGLERLPARVRARAALDRPGASTSPAM